MENTTQWPQIEDEAASEDGEAFVVEQGVEEVEEADEAVGMASSRNEGLLVRRPKTQARTGEHE